MKYFLVITTFLFLNLTQNYSQLKDTSNHYVFCGTDINPGYIDCGNSIIGPVLGYSIKSKVLIYGLNYEYAFAQNRTGIFTIGARGKFSTNKEDVLDNTAKLKTQNISFGLQGNFNFNRLSANSVIPYAGIVLGYNYSLTEYDFNSGTPNPLFPDTKKHSFYIFGRAGVRFFLSHNIALNISFGSGNIDKSAMELGLDYKF